MQKPIIFRGKEYTLRELNYRYDELRAGVDRENSWYDDALMTEFDECEKLLREVTPL